MIPPAGQSGGDLPLLVRQNNCCFVIFCGHFFYRKLFPLDGRGSVGNLRKTQFFFDVLFVQNIVSSQLFTKNICENLKKLRTAMSFLGGYKESRFFVGNPIHQNTTSTRIPRTQF